MKVTKFLEFRIQYANLEMWHMCIFSKLPSLFSHSCWWSSSDEKVCMEVPVNLCRNGFIALLRRHQSVSLFN